MSFSLSSALASSLSFFDPDYRRMRKAIGKPYSPAFYWYFLEFRRQAERKRLYDRKDRQLWSDFYEFTPLPPEADQPDLALQEAQALFGLHEPYSREEFEEAAKGYFANLKRRSELGEAYNKALVARKAILRARGWRH